MTAEGGAVRTREESDRARSTHPLERAEGGTCQDLENKRLREGHSLSGDDRGNNLSGHRKKATSSDHLPTGDNRGRDLSGHGKKASNKGDSPTGGGGGKSLSGHVKKASEQGAHFLETARGGTCQDRNKASKGEALTCWRQQGGKGDLL